MLNKTRLKVTLTSDVDDGLWSEDLVLKQSLGLSQLQVWLPAALHRRGLLQTARYKTPSRKLMRDVGKETGLYSFSKNTSVLKSL